MNANFFRIEGWRSIGNKKYLEIVFVEDINPSGKEPAISQSNKIKKLDKKAKTEISNLNVFLDLYKSNTKEIKWETGMEIFFNSECPLRYVGYNHDYYWDKKVFHSFEVSCLLDSNKPLVIYLEGNSLGELPLNNKWSTNLDKDSLYLVRVILENWKGERIVWKDPLLYTYED